MLIRTIIGLAVALFLAVPVSAQTYPAPYLPDRFNGDTNIYSGAVTAVLPNVLFMVDNSAGMAQPGNSEPYDPTRTYQNNGFVTNAIYVRTAATGGTINYNTYMASVTSVTCTTAKAAFDTAGYFAGTLKKQDGSCNATQEGNYYLGNLLNYMFAPSTIRLPNTAYAAGDVVKAAAGDQYTWTCTVAGISGATAPAWPTIPDPIPADFWSSPPTVTDGGVTWQVSSPLIALVTTTMNQIMPSVREKVKAGLVVFGNNNSGGAIRAPIKYIGLGTSGQANYTNLLAKFNELAAPNGLLGGNQQSVNELLYDTDWYFKGLNNSTEKISSDTVPYPSPIENYCQESFVIAISTGASHSSGTSVYTKIGDWNADGTVGYVEDAAKRLYDTDHLVDAVKDPEGKIQRVRTIVIQLVTTRVPNLVMAAAFGNGKNLTYEQAQTMDTSELRDQGIYYYNVQTAEELIRVLSDTMLEIILQAHTAFVAPTIPVSQQENLRSYSGDRVYMGFFRPISKRPWRGNLKKYGIDPTTGNILDVNGTLATYEDHDGDFKDDRDGVTLPQGKVNGDFRPDSRSYWTTLQCIDDISGNAVVLPQNGDGGVVDCGGVGEKLVLRTAARNIYTFLPQTMLSTETQSTDLTAPVNQFKIVNTAISTQILNYFSTDEALAKPSLEPFQVANPDNSRSNLMRFLHGTDVYLFNPPNYVPSIAGRRMWIMGDVLHSKPVVIGYKTFGAGQENNCTSNKSMIYIGSNDGMLHAFRDCDGEEEWAYIPTNVLGTLRQMTGTLHTYYVDSTIEKYIYDADRDGNIEADDRVFLIFGQRRGGGLYRDLARGYYTILEVTNPLKPVMIAQFGMGGFEGVLGQFGTGTTANLTGIGETWSEPKLAKMKIGGSDVIVMFVGGGYDNCNEDSRFGATQSFPGACALNSTPDTGIVTSTSSATGEPYYPRGRAIVAMKIATLDASGSPTVSVSRIWRYTPSAMYAMASELLLMDINFDGYVDRVYGGDTGGNLWRFDVGSTSATEWKGTRIFAANPGIGGAGDTGRKVFFKGDGTVEATSVNIYFATGDREHPLNRAVIDRVYAFFDKKDADYTSGPRTESNLVDVTEDKLQTASTQSAIDQELLDLQTKDGWFVRLDGQDLTPPTANPGEKALATVSLSQLMLDDGVHGLVWVTTYRPLTTAVSDPCIPGNMGYADALHFDYKTGEAKISFDKKNDTSYSSLSWNSRAVNQGKEVLQRSDRRVHLGRGIPSGVVPRITPGGDISLGVGVGGGYDEVVSGSGAGVQPLYWRRR